jgi:hypothetical protein
MGFPILGEFLEQAGMPDDAVLIGPAIAGRVIIRE